MQVNEAVHKDLLQKMAKDKEFLKQCHLMDYSLLLVVINSPNEVDADGMSFEESEVLSNESGIHNIYHT